MTTKNYDALDKALELLDFHGWCQDSYLEDPSGKMCMSYALGQAAESPKQVVALNRLVIRATFEVDNCKPFFGRSLMGWNDMPGRRFSEVVAALLTARKYAEKEGK